MFFLLTWTPVLNFCGTPVLGVLLWRSRGAFRWTPNLALGLDVNNRAISMTTSALACSALGAHRDPSTCTKGLSLWRSLWRSTRAFACSRRLPALGARLLSVLAKMSGFQWKFVRFSPLKLLLTVLWAFGCHFSTSDTMVVLRMIDEFSNFNLLLTLVCTQHVNKINWFQASLLEREWVLSQLSKLMWLEIDQHLP